MPPSADLLVPAVDVDQPPLGGQHQSVGGPQVGGGRGQECFHGGGEGGQVSLALGQLERGKE